SCMKGWNSCFFLIDQRAIPDYRPCRHLDSAIDDPKPPVGSYNQEDVRRLNPTLEDLVAGTPSTKVMAKAESSKKRKALLYGATPSHVAKCTRSAMAQSSRSTTRPNLFAADSDEESDDDEDACVEIPIITPI
ncbi:hypothetical protein Tco_0074668, partial [Tanacetum coccineum]